jgi:hypothetical protein
MQVLLQGDGGGRGLQCAGEGAGEDMGSRMEEEEEEAVVDVEATGEGADGSCCR